MRKAGTSLKTALESVALAKSSYCHKPSGSRKPRALDPGLVEALEAVCQGYEAVYGYRKMAETLEARGIHCNKKKVLRHMRVLKITQPRKIKGLKWTCPAVVKPTAPNTYWETDFTYVWDGSTNAYCCPVIDAWDKDIVGDSFSERCRAVEACAALENAVLNRFGGKVPVGHILTLRVDRGSQFKARRFKETAKALNVRLEYAGIQCPEDKPYIESFNGSYKKEEVYRREYRGLSDARAGWETYRAWYKNERLHQNLGYKSPRTFRETVGNQATRNPTLCMA